MTPKCNGTHVLARESLQWLVSVFAVAVACLLGQANSQAAPLNSSQEAVLALEAEAKTFISFGADLTEPWITRIQGTAIRRSTLDELQAEAGALLELVEDLIAEAAAFSGGPNFYAEPGVEMDADALYRMSAFDLWLYFISWQYILTRVVEAEPTSPAGDFSTAADSGVPYDLQEQLNQARVFRLLANQHYRQDLRETR